MQRRSAIAALLLGLLTALGCAEPPPRPTLVIHAHDDRYDFLDHDSNPVATTTDIDEFDAILGKPNVERLIRGDRIVLRFEGQRTADGVTVPETLIPAIAELLGSRIMNIEFEYTND